MAYELRTCRICKNQVDSADLYKYGTRHYAHWACYFRAFLKSADDCKNFVLNLPTHLVGSLPVFVYSSHYQGMFDEAQGEARQREAVAFVTKTWKRKQKEDARELAKA